MKLSSAGVWSAACVVTALACGDSDADPSASPNPDGGVNPSPDASVDGSTSDGATGTGPMLLKAGLVVPVGVTPAGMVVYAVFPSGKIDGPADIEAVPITGGTPVKIATNLGAAGMNGAKLSGGALAWWTNVTDGIGTLNVWNATDGVKTALSTTSAVPTQGDGREVYFYATADGRRVVFSTNATAETTNLQVADVATATTVTTGMLPADDVVLRELPLTECAGSLRFAGKNFIASFCRADKQPRAYAVPDGSTTAVRLDDKGDVAALGPIKPSILRADDTGNRVFVPGLNPLHGRVLDLTNASAIVSTQLSVDEAFVTKDGAVVSLSSTTGDVTRWNPDGAKKRLARGVTELLVPTNVGARALIKQNKIAPIYRTFELNTETVTKTIAPVEPLLLVMGFTGSGNHIVFGRAVGDPPSFAVSARPSVGGPETELATGLGGTNQVFIPPEGDAVVVMTNVTPLPADGLYPKDIFGFATELRYVDAGTGAYVAVDDGAFLVPLFSGKKVVYLRCIEPGAGIYVFDPK